MRSLFIYWKVPPALAAQAQAAAQCWQASLRAAHPGLQARLYQRGDASTDGQATFMETYAVAGGVTPAVQAAIANAGSAGLQPLGAPRRHEEVFDALDAPAADQPRSSVIGT